MKNFVFQNKTKIYFGKGQIVNLRKEITKFGKKALLVYGGGSIKKTGVYDEVVNELKEAGVEFLELSGVEPNPRHTTVNKGAKICKDNGIDVILAVGGGSVIDCAKCIAAAAKYEGDDSWDLVSSKATVTSTLPLISIPTIAATGSEMNGGCVISNMNLNMKMSYSAPDNNPDVSFLDPTYTYSVNKYQTASGSADIMAHIFDLAYFSTEDSMDMLLRIQEEVLKTVVKYGPIAINEPNNYEARANLMWASTWALNGFMYDGLKRKGLCHAIDHQLSAYYDITHGHGLAIIIPRWLRYILNDETAPRIYRFGINVMGLKENPNIMDGAIDAIDSLEDLFYNKFGLPSRLSDLGIDDKCFSLMADKAVKSRGDTKLYGFTVIDYNDVINILRMCL